MTRSAIVALFVLTALPLFAAERKPSEMDKALARIEAAAKPADATAPMLFIMAHAQEAPALPLFLSSVVALADDRLEDAAFLFYAGQMRTRYDLTRFPPKASGGDSPGVALGALSQQLGAEINPTIMREPASFAKVVARVETWAPAIPADYDPGWEYTAVQDVDAKRQFTENRAAFVKQFGGLSTLLNDPEYFAAFTAIQEYNFSPYEEQQNPERMKEKKAAEEKMLAIETKKGIEGLYFRKGA
jgi:hypothetical protein